MKITQGKVTIRRWAEGDWEWVCRIDGCLGRYPPARIALSSHLVALVTAERHVKEFHPRASCPGYETTPNPCRCPCYGCKHHCSAHNPDNVEVSDE